MDTNITLPVFSPCRGRGRRHTETMAPREQEQETTVVVARSTIVEYQGFAHNSVMRCSVLQILLGSGMTGLSLCGLILVAMGDARRDYRIWDGLLVGEDDFFCC